MSLDEFTYHHWRRLDAGDIVVSTTAQGLMENAFRYFQWCDENPIKKVGTIKTGARAGDKLIEELPRPYSLKSLCLHLGVEEDWLRDIRKRKAEDSEYYIVVSRIMLIIYTQNYELASVGELNPIFMSKALGMDKDEVPTGGVKVTIVGELPPLSRSENEILEKLDLENRANENNQI